MPNPSSSTALIYYPAYCFPISPTFNTWAKLTAADVTALDRREGFQSQKIYFHLNHPIKYVRLVGIIVGVDDNEHRHILYLDDSSGATIEITCPRERIPPPQSVPTNGATATDAQYSLPRRPGYLTTKGRTVSGNEIDLAGIDVGTVIKVKGGLNVYKENLQISLERFNIISTTTAEAHAWDELHEFRTNVLSKPWYVSPEQQKKLREKIEGGKKREEERLRRKKHKELKLAKYKAHKEAKEAKLKAKAEDPGQRELETKREKHDKGKDTGKDTIKSSNLGPEVQKEEEAKRLDSEEEQMKAISRMMKAKREWHEEQQIQQEERERVEAAENMAEPKSEDEKEEEPKRINPQEEHFKLMRRFLKAKREEQTKEEQAKREMNEEGKWKETAKTSKIESKVQKEDEPISLTPEEERMKAIRRIARAEFQWA